MADKLEFTIKLIEFLEGLASAKEVLNDPRKLQALSAESAKAIALTDKEKATRAEHEKFMAESAAFRERIAKHDANKAAFEKEMQEQKDAFERLKSEHLAGLRSKTAALAAQTDEVATTQKQMQTKYGTLREEWKKKEATYHEWARKLDLKERDISQREEKLARELEKA